MQNPRGRKKGLTASQLELREAFRVALQKVLSQHELSQTALAKRMGVKKQSISKYLRGETTPQSEVLGQYFGEFDVPIELRSGATITREGAHRGPQPAQPLQYPLLFDSIASVSNNQLQVTVTKRTPSSLQLSVSIDFMKREAV